MRLRADAKGWLVALHLTSGERYDLLGVSLLFELVTLSTGECRRPRWEPNAVTPVWAYSAAWLLEILRRKHIVPIIPGRADQPGNPDFDRTAYRWRSLVERLVGKRKQFRRLTTRYDKVNARYLALVQVASVLVLLRNFGDKI